MPLTTKKSLPQSNANAEKQIYEKYANCVTKIAEIKPLIIRDQLIQLHQIN